MTKSWSIFFCRHQRLLFIATLCLLGTLAYANTIHVPFLFDDYQNIVTNQHIRLTDLTVERLGDAGFASPHPHRWVAYISFALNYFVHQYNPAGYHIVNITIHISTAILIFFLFQITLQRPPLAERYAPPQTISFFAALLWLVHPLQTGAVTYTVQRMTSLATMFYILALLLYVHGRLTTKTKKRLIFWLASILAGILAMGSKEIAATLPLFVLLYEYFFFQDLDCRKRKGFVPLVVGALLLFCLMAFAFLGPNALEAIQGTYAHRDFTLGQRVLTQSRVLILYLSLLLYPHPSRLNLDHDMVLSLSLFDPLSTLFSILTLISIIIFAFFVAKKHRLAAFAIFWFLGNLIIESSIIGLEMIFEHRLYLSSIFLCLLVVTIINKLRSPWLKFGILLSICFTFAGWTHTRNTVWHSDLTLWSDVIKKSPLKARGYNGVGMHFFQNKQPQQAIPFFQKSLLINNLQAKPHNNLGLCFLGVNKVDQAISEFTKAIAIKPNNGMYHVNLGIAYWQKGIRNLASKEFRLGKKLNQQQKKPPRTKTSP